MRNAGDPSGASANDRSQPAIVYVGKPVGWSVPRSGGTAWNSAVSQNATPGRSVPRASHRTATATPIGPRTVSARSIAMTARDGPASIGEATDVRLQVGHSR
jgi:hypothetical protein